MCPLLTRFPLGFDGAPKPRSAGVPGLHKIRIDVRQVGGGKLDPATIKRVVDLTMKRFRIERGDAYSSDYGFAVLTAREAFLEMEKAEKALTEQAEAEEAKRRALIANLLVVAAIGHSIAMIVVLGLTMYPR
jgi:hypothetical protein